MSDLPSILYTPLCRLLGIRYPIVQAPMAGGMTTPALVSAVCNAGGLGSFAASRLTNDQIRDAIAAIKSQTDRPFAVNFIVARPETNTADIDEAQDFLDQFREELGIAMGPRDFKLRPPNVDEQIYMALEARVPILSTALGDPVPWVERAHAVGTKVMAMVSTVDEAIHCAEHGVDVIVAQGAEAGGHRSTFQLGPNGECQLVGGIALIPQVVDAVRTPVIATGGIMDGRGVVAALALGASGAQLGTRFLVARESATMPAYRERLFNATEADTIITRAVSGRPTRSVRNKLLDTYRERGVEPPPFPYQQQLAADIFRAAIERGDADYFPLQAGQGLRLLKRDQGAAQIVEELIEEAAAVIARLRA